MTLPRTDGSASVVRAALWEVKIGTYIESVRVVAPLDATLDEVARTAKVAMHEQFQSHVRPEHAAHDTAFWTDAVAAKDVTSITRCEDVVLQPRIGGPA
jgi:hypothetical protein